jgi:hypothetical protein
MSRADLQDGLPEDDDFILHMYIVPFVSGSFCICELGECGDDIGEVNIGHLGARVTGLFCYDCRDGFKCNASV